MAQNNPFITLTKASSGESISLNVIHVVTLNPIGKGGVTEVLTTPGVVYGVREDPQAIIDQIGRVF